MEANTRRTFLKTIAAGAGAAAAAPALAADGDGHAAGTDVASSADFVRTIPRKPGQPAPFTASLDGGKIKATSGGWARDVTANQLPIATGIAGAHLYLNPGGVREMHWHASAEWGYIVAGRCQATIIDPQGQREVVNLGAGDTWYFPNGHAHAIQTIGAAPCHAILAFDDGLYGEHGTFGLTDWMSRMEPALLAKATGAPEAVVRAMPEGETYIMQGPVVSLSQAAAREEALDPARTHRYALAKARPIAQSDGGVLRVASAREFPKSAAMTGFRLTLEPGAIQTPHWHPNANEWLYLVKGRAKIGLFSPDKRMGGADLGPGDCAYIPRACGHVIESTGAEPCEIVGALDNGAYVESSLSQWLAQAPRHLLAANLGLPEAAAEAIATRVVAIAAAT